MTSDLLVLPPQDLEAERAVLGAILLDAAIFSTVTGVFTQRDFYQPRHGVIYAAMEILADGGEPIDHLTMSDQLRKTGQLESVAGSSYLAELLKLCVLNFQHQASLSVGSREVSQEATGPHRA